MLSLKFKRFDARAFLVCRSTKMKVELEQSSEIKIKLEKLQKDYAMMERDKEKVHFFSAFVLNFQLALRPSNTSHFCMHLAGCHASTPIVQRPSLG